MYWSGLGALLLALAVMFGAFGAHALRARLDAYSMGIYERAVFYHFVHALGLLVVPLLVRAEWITPSTGLWTCALLLAGILVFSGSLYALAMTGVRGLGAITPLGGVAFILGWLLLAFALIRASLVR
jgi:uncharacterized membrane protein YgdD (TMEM256/DUF423 family)